VPNNETDILIIGAGPVGLTLALDLGLRGLNVMLVDRKAELLRLPKMERTNPRTMEIFRRLGIVEQIRAAGYPADMPMDVCIVTSLAEPPLLHQEYPSVAETRARAAACHDGSLPREPYQLISQYTLEPILLARLSTLPNVTVRFQTEFVSLTQDETQVTVQFRKLVDDEIEEMRVAYVAACDGASSPVRKQLGIKMAGTAQLGAVTNVFFRSEDLFEKAAVPPARHYCFAGRGAGGGAAGTLIVQDDRRHFAYHTVTPPAGDLAQEIRQLTGLDINPEILHAGTWVQHMLVAERHSEKRVFLVGDANHIFIPAGGLGMNTGIGDAINLGWKLAAVVRGWGGTGLLESYHHERSAVAHRNIAAVEHAVDGVRQWRGIPLTDEICLDTAAGRKMRANFVRDAEPLNRRVYEMHGADLGYRYVSPVICDEPGDPPADDSDRYVPSTWPGAHLPHVWIERDVGLFDVLGPGYTLLRLGDAPAGSAPLELAFAKRRVPLEVRDIDSPAIRAVYEKKLVLVRPDLHVAWRGDELPADVTGLAARVTGHVPEMEPQNPPNLGAHP